MNYTHRKTNTHIHPDGKLRPPIHELVGGNPGEQHALYVISTHIKTRRKANTHLSHWILRTFCCNIHGGGKPGCYMSTHRHRGLHEVQKYHVAQIKQFLRYLFFFLVIFGAILFAGQDCTVLCTFGRPFPCLFKNDCRFFFLMLWKLFRSVSTFCELHNSRQGEHR